MTSYRQLGSTIPGGTLLSYPKSGQEWVKMSHQGDHRGKKIRSDNTLLHMDKELSTSWLFYKSVPNDKHSSTQYIKQYK